jgi:hypothetical protein
VLCTKLKLNGNEKTNRYVGTHRFSSNAEFCSELLMMILMEPDVRTWEGGCYDDEW